jgi:hypothetical protein
MKQDENEEDRRRFRRVDFESDAELARDGRVWATELLDISLNGALVRRPDNWEQSDSPLELRVRLGDGPPEREIKMKARPVHRSGDAIGMEREEMDAKSMAELKKLLEYNLDPVQVQREFSELLEVKGNSEETDSNP